MFLVHLEKSISIFIRIDGFSWQGNKKHKDFNVRVNNEC
jgi:hypothetical protein